MPVPDLPGAACGAVGDDLAQTFLVTYQLTG